MTLNSWKPGTAQNSKHNVLAEYIQDTSSKAGVDDVTLYNTKVEHLSKAHGKWNIQTSFLDVGNSMITTKDWVNSISPFILNIKLSHSRNSMP